MLVLSRLWLWQCCVDRPSSLSAAPGSGCAECGCLVDLPAVLLRSHHRHSPLAPHCGAQNAQQVKFKIAMRVYKVW